MENNLLKKMNKLNPDQLEDIGDLLDDFAKVSKKYLKDREMEIHDVCYCLLYLGTCIALDDGHTLAEVKDVISKIWKSCLTHYD